MFSPRSNQQTPTQRKIGRKMTESSHKSSRKIEIQALPSGIRIIIAESILAQNHISSIRDSLIRYLKYEDSYQKLRPVDIQIMNEYALTQVSFVKEFSEKKELIVNMLLHLFFYRNAKYIKQCFQEKNQADDIKEFQRLLVFHKSELNSLEVRTLLTWLHDYIAHYDLFYFKALSDDGLDIVYNVVLDIPTFVPPLSQANFIPQNNKQYADVDSEEEEKYAKRRIKMEKENQEVEDELQDNQEQNAQQDNEQKKPNEFEEYIQQQVFGTSQQLFQKIEEQNKIIIEQVEKENNKKKK
ncbi:unnamed protein product [Paramecium octaurelia]|uniref:Uncharacterized protein n=1 Tax=Paramecium octaurelia TaxID=43137 RepID=A0A8S1UEM3_PAROT|nr:unnamed protein product [Paramecium octaurelia]